MHGTLLPSMLATSQSSSPREQSMICLIGADVMSSMSSTMEDQNLPIISAEGSMTGDATWMSSGYLMNLDRVSM